MCASVIQIFLVACAHAATAGIEKAKAKELSERQSATRLLTNARFIINASLLAAAWVVLLMLIRVLRSSSNEDTQLCRVGTHV